MTDLPRALGVVGAGTMGAGIAQLACLAGARTLLHDPVPEALERGITSIKAQLERGGERGRWSAEDAAAAAARLEAAETLLRRLGAVDPGGAATALVGVCFLLVAGTMLTAVITA